MIHIANFWQLAKDVWLVLSVYSRTILYKKLQAFYVIILYVQNRR